MEKLSFQSVKKILKSSPVSMNNKYLLFLPKDYGRKDKLWPLILFLHGAGERGSNIVIVKRNGPPKILETKKDFKFIVVSPQCKKEMKWIPAELNNLLEEVTEEYHVDISRIYLTGLSMGGAGTWDMAVEYPEKFAAIAPVCGAGNPSEVYKIKNLPVWAFHGAKDNVVPVERSVEMINALKACGGNPKLTIYPEAEHDSWTETYDNPKLYEWLMNNKKK